MRANRIALAIVPAVLMAGLCLALTGIEAWLSKFGTTPKAHLVLGRIGIALPYVIAAAIGAIFLFAAAGATAIRFAGWSVVFGSLLVVAIATSREISRLHSFANALPAGDRLLAYADPSTIIGATVAALAAVFGLRVAMRGNAAFAAAEPRRIHGRRAIHGEADWMTMTEAVRLFPEAGGIVVGERYRVDRDAVTNQSFRADDTETWGAGGKSPLLCFDASFGSSHGIVFAGSGGFKTTSVTVPTTLKWGGGLVVLDPSNEVAPMVTAHRHGAGRQVFVLDPRASAIGFNVLDWIGQHGATKEEDIAAVASWVMTDNPRQGSARDDFFRASALQLLTALIADVCLSGHTEKKDQHLRQVRANLSEPEPKLRQRLQTIYDNSESGFVKENVAPFIAMTPETFSGVYANAVKETHWLSYANYAVLVSGSNFTTAELAEGRTDVFINLDLKTLENHAGLARVIIGSLLNAIYNRNGEVTGRTLFLLDEVARLGYLRILETLRLPTIFETRPNRKLESPESLMIL
ncbi:type IV secretion system protein VirD4 [Bradyrhizobium liaoningense]